MRDLLHLDLLKQGKALLAFSGGADSTALFHLLLENGIDFDIAHVNYHMRPSSDAEAQSAARLAASHARVCHTRSCRLEGENFEHRAREERYRFFGRLMEKHGYCYLLTAHQLNDRLEWMMMQLCRGAGLPELLGIRSMDRRDGMTIVRPLLEWDRPSIEGYLDSQHIPFHTDESNADERYTRNRFRHRYATPLIREYGSAIRRSFRYLEEDSDALIEAMDFESAEELFFASNPSSLRSLAHGIDAVFKSIGYVMGHHEKEGLKKGGTHVIARRYVVSIEAAYTFIAPYRSGVVMEGGFREECRRLRIDPKLRGYLYGAPEAWQTIRRLKGAPTPLRSD